MRVPADEGAEVVDDRSTGGADCADDCKTGKGSGRRCVDDVRGVIVFILSVALITAAEKTFALT